MRVGVIGAGLGGLLAGAALAREGHRVTVFERLPYPGGRFANLAYHGYTLSTGALHLIPHGATGPLGRLLRRLGVKVPIVRTNPPGLFRFNGRDYRHTELPELFGAWNKMRLVKLTADLRYSRGGDESYLEWVAKRISHKKVFDLANSFCRWALSLDADEVSSREVVSITRNVDRYGPPGVPLGGCGAVSQGLVRVIEGFGGELRYQESVEEILIADGRAVGLATGEESFSFDAVVSDIGPLETARLCGKAELEKSYLRSLAALRPAEGVKITFSSTKPLVGHTCTLFTPEAERVGGLVELTHLDPGLAPKGRHLLMSHQKLCSGDVEREIEMGIEDLRSQLPGFDRCCEVLMVQCYRGHWPVNRVASGLHVGAGTPIRGLYNVGDGVKPEGLMETDGVAGGVLEMLEKFNKDMVGG